MSCVVYRHKAALCLVKTHIQYFRDMAILPKTKSRVQCLLSIGKASFLTVLIYFWQDKMLARVQSLGLIKSLMYVQFHHSSLSASDARERKKCAHLRFKYLQAIPAAGKLGDNKIRIKKVSRCRKIKKKAASRVSILSLHPLSGIKLSHQLIPDTCILGFFACGNSTSTSTT